MNEMSYRGKWWLPSDSLDDGVAGEFTFAPEDGGELQLIGAFRDFEEMSTVTEVETIFGITTEGNRITLKDCSIMLNRIASSSANMRTERCRAREVFIDGHFDGNVLLDRVSLSFPLLENWTQYNTVVRPDSDRDMIEILDVDPLVANVDGTEIKLDVESGGTLNMYRGADITQEVFVRIEPEDALSFEKYRDYYIRKLQQFFSLGIGEPLNPSRIKGVIEHDNEENQDIEIGYPVSRPTHPGESIHPHDLNFALGDIDFEEALPTWFENHDAVETLHNLYFATLYHDDMYVRNQFLSLVIALESYHRDLYDDYYYMEGDEYSDLVGWLEEEMPDVAAKPRILDLLRSGMGNEYSLKDRLEEITADHATVLESLMDVYTTVRDIRDARHEIAHGDEEERDLRELYQLSQRMQVIVEVCLLDALGLDEDHIREKMQNNHGSYLEQG
jgi:hypothetical protein